MDAFSEKNFSKQQEELWKELYEKNYDKVYKTALRIVIDREFAKDVAHEAFVCAFLKIDTLKDKNKFSAWICSITANIAKNALKQKNYLSFKCIPLETVEKKTPGDFYHRASELLNPELLCEEYDTIQKILDIIGEANMEEKTIFHLKYNMGFTYAEIAEKMNIKEGTVRMKMLRTRRKVCEKLGIFPTCKRTDIQEK